MFALLLLLSSSPMAGQFSTGGSTFVVADSAAGVDITKAFQKAVTSLGKTGGTIVIPLRLAPYVLGSVTILNGVHVQVSQGVVIRPARDSDLVTLSPGASWTGGIFDCTDSFASSVFILDGTSRFNTAMSRTFIRDVRLDGGATGTAVDMRSLGADGNIYGVLVEDLYIKGFEYGLRQRRTGVVNTNWINGNTFSSIWFNGTLNGISQEEPVAGFCLDGNRFLALDYQYSPKVSKGIRIMGSGNRVEGTFWDWPIGSTAVEFTAGSTHNLGAFMTLQADRVVDSGTANVVTTLYGGNVRP